MSQTANTNGKLTPIVLGALLFGALCAGEAADAHDEKSAFQMTVIRDAAHGGRVSSGFYDDAIARIERANIRPSERFYASNNLCVAYTKSGDLEKARGACDEAVELARAEPAAAPQRAHIDSRYRALALSNRGVLKAIDGDLASARADFVAAIELKGGLSAPARNLEHLDSRSAQASTALQAGR